MTHEEKSILKSRLAECNSQFRYVKSAMENAGKDSANTAKRYVTLSSVLYFSTCSFFANMCLPVTRKNMESFLDSVYSALGMSRGSGGKKGAKVPQSMTRFCQVMLDGAEFGIDLIPATSCVIDAGGHVTQDDAENNPFAAYRKTVTAAKPETAQEYLNRVVKHVQVERGFICKDEDAKKIDKDRMVREFADFLLAEFSLSMDDVETEEVEEVEVEFEFVVNN